MDNQNDPQVNPYDTLVDAKTGVKLSEEHDPNAVGDNYGDIKVITNGKYVFEFFPEGYNVLQKELCTGLHPKLEELLSKHPVDELDVRIAEIAAYVGVVLDGAYTLPERDKLCYVMAGRLETMREIPQAQNIILN